MTHYDPPTVGYFVPEQARENSTYYLCRLANGQVVQITWLPRENPGEQSPRLISAVRFGNIVERTGVVEQYDSAGEQNVGWNPWTYPQATRAARLAQAPIIGQPMGPRPAAVDAPGTPQRHLIYPLPIGVVLDPAALVWIIRTWTVQHWQTHPIVQWLNALPTNYRFLFVTNRAALGDAWLPPIPFGFQDDRVFWSGWNLRPPRDNTTIDWHVTRSNTGLLQDRNAQTPAIANCDLSALGDAGRYLIGSLTTDNGSEITIEVADRSAGLGQETLCVINLDQRMTNHRTIQGVLTSIYGEWPRPIESPEPVAATPQQPEGLDPDEVIARLFENFGGPPEPVAPSPRSYQARQQARERLQQNLRGQRQQHDSQTALNAVRMTALQHGHIDFQFEEFWPSPEHSNRRAVAQMTDQELWNAVTYCVRERHSLQVFYAEEDDRSMVPECWMRDRPLFESLIAQAVARELAFADDVASFLRTYVPSNDVAFDVVPWADEEARESQRDLRQQLTEQNRRKRNRRDRDARQLRRFDIQ